MKYFLILSAILISTVTLSGQARAQDTLPQVYEAPVNPYYDFMVQQAMRHMSENFRFNRFRYLYVNSKQYDPLGDNVIDQLQRYAFAVQSEKDPEKRAIAIESYRNIVMAHMANIRVVAQALSLARADSSFGKPAFFEWLRKGLVRDILAHGDGNTLRSAYNVTTLTEETVLIGQLGFRVLDTQSAHEGALYYNMHDVENINTGQKETLFVNTTRPMLFLEGQRKETGNTFTILRQ